MSFKEIFCQDKTIAVLQRAFLSSRWAHAYIFAGQEGVGKFKTANEWAKLLLCESPSIENGFADSCSSCRSCRAFQVDSHPGFNHIYKELLEFTKEGKGKKTPVDLSIDVIREFLIEKVATKPTLSQRKVFVVSEAEKLNAASQNALLKVLEEPPAYCCIILLCTRLERLLPTTKSRCQIIRFGSIDEDRIIEKLKEMGLEKTEAQYFARLSAGSLGTACQWAELELANTNLYQTKKKLINSLGDFEFADAVELAQNILEDSKRIAAVWSGLDKTTSKTDINRRAQKTLIQIIISAFHDAMKLNVASARLETPESSKSPPVGISSKKEQFLTVSGQTEINFDQKEQVKKLADRFDAEQAAKIIADCYRMLRWVESGVNEKLIFEQMLLNLASSDIIGFL